MMEYVFPQQYARVGEADMYLEQPRQNHAMRRRVLVFCVAFLLCLLVTLSYTFMRSAIYLASARIQIAPSAPPAGDDKSAPPDSTPAFLMEVQMLTSRPLLEKVAARLKEQGHLKTLSADPPALLQSMLTVAQVTGTQVVLVQAQGENQGLVAPLINAVIDVYRDEQVAGGITTSQTRLAQTREEVRVIETKVAEKSKTLEALKLQSNIVSGERDENQAFSSVKGLGTSLSAANDREAIAAGRVRAIEQAIAEGKRSPQAKDNPTVAGIESRLSQMKEEWRALERQFTSQYLDMDPDARGLSSRISNLEQQLDVERQKSQQMALADAREELATVRATTQRLQQQLAADKQGVQTFSRRFSEYQVMQEELQGLELMRQTARQKLLALEASETSRRPRVLVVEPAVTPEGPWRPLYGRDAGISLAASLVLGFLAVWFVEFFNRIEPQAPNAPVLRTPQPWMALAPSQSMRLGTAEEPRLLTPPLPRELGPDEIASLLDAATPENLGILACLLCGLTADEIVSLQRQHVDPVTGRLTVPGEATRVVPAPAHLLVLAKQRESGSPEAPLFLNNTARPLDAQDVHSVVTSTAYDADLEQPQSVTPATLHHTYVAFLVRQGLRFSELGHLVGRLSAESLALLAPRVSMDSIEPTLPALRHR